MDALLERVWEYSQNNPDGFTITLDMLPATSGYSVAVAETQNSFGKEGLKRVIDYALRHHTTIGGWYNSMDGRYYFDATIIVQDRDTAIRLGRANNQFAIFDFEKREEIAL